MPIEQALGAVKPTVASSLTFAEDRTMVVFIPQTTVPSFMLRKGDAIPLLPFTPSRLP